MFSCVLFVVGDELLIVGRKVASWRVHLMPAKECASKGSTRHSELNEH